MNFKERLKFYLLGLIGGLFLVMVFFGRRSSCRNGIRDYLPNGRVLAEIKTLPILYSNEALSTMQQLNIDTAYIQQKILVEGDINFDRSDARKKPCSDYIINYQDSLRHIEMNFEKCKSNVLIKSIK